MKKILFTFTFLFATLTGAFSYTNDETQGRLVIKQLADMNTPRISHQIMETEDGIAVFGGHTTGFAMTMTAERYNRETNSWTQMTMPNYHDYSGSIILDDGQLLIMGGMSSNSGVGASNKCDYYDPKTNSFTTAANLTVPRSMMKADRTESGKIYFMGCWYNSSYSVECYDQETKTFSKAADGFSAFMPFVFAMRGERVVVAYENRLLLVENGTSTDVESDLFDEYTILKPWHEVHMKDYKLADGSAVVVARNNNKEAALLRIYDDATKGIQVEKIVDLPMTLPNNANTPLAYEIEATRIFCDNAAKKIYMMCRVDGDPRSPGIVEYAYASTGKLTGGSTTVYAPDKRLDLYVIDGAWLRLADGTFISTGGNTSNDSRANFNAHAATYAYTLTKGQKGDANGDGSVDVADIATIITIMASGAEGDSKAFDVNGDGVIDVADIAAIITIMAGQ